jgi:hypothetical protein
VNRLQSPNLGTLPVSNRVDLKARLDKRLPDELLDRQIVQKQAHR